MTTYRIYRDRHGRFLWGPDDDSGPHPACTPQAGTTDATIDACETLRREGIDLSTVTLAGRVDKATAREYGVRRATKHSTYIPPSRQREQALADLWGETRKDRVPLGEFVRRAKEIFGK